MDSQRFRALRATACSPFIIVDIQELRAPFLIRVAVVERRRVLPCVIRVTIPPPLRLVTIFLP